MKRLFSILIIILFCQTTFAYNPFWVHLDKKLINGIVKLDKNCPQSIEQYFIKQKCKTKKDNLGFGWTMWTTGIGGGYISISAKFYYYHDSIVSFTLIPALPTEQGLIEKYKKWYGSYFTYDSNNILPYDFNENQILRPLAEYNGTLTPHTIPCKILQYMSPKSGTEYAINGNYGAKIPENRKEFAEIKDSLSNDQIVLLMYSINPASRFMAIEYYFKSREQFSDTTTINKWVEKNFTEIPKVEVLMSCTYSYLWDTKTLIEMYSKMEENK
jgi:hypothetical protein